MVIYLRYRQILIPFFFYLLAGGGITYFLWQATQGERGLATHQAYQALLAEHQAELAAVQKERSYWEYRITLMRPESVDQDLLEEKALLLLGRVHKNDLVLFVAGEEP